MDCTIEKTDSGKFRLRGMKVVVRDWALSRFFTRFKLVQSVSGEFDTIEELLTSKHVFKPTGRDAL